MLYVIGTEIFQFEPLGAEKFTFKIFTWHFWHTEIMANCNVILSTGCLMKIRLFWRALAQRNKAYLRAIPTFFMTPAVFLDCNK